ncbi:Syntaxin-7 [Allomyces arbusculus]|nr:Syntaxin-7 [Allomyces arbusculus]
MSLPPPASYETTLAHVSQALNTLQRHIDTLHSRLRLLGTPRDTAPLRDKIHRLQDETKQLLLTTANDLARLAALANQSGVPQNKLATQRITADFQTLTARFRDFQAEFTEKSKADIARAKMALAHEEERMDREDAPLLSTGGASSSDAQQHVLVHDLDIAYNETLIAEREAEIRDIEDGVHMVNDIFRKIGTMVKDQGQLFDNIEANLQTADVHVENAAVQLNTANKRGRWWREVKCRILLVLVAIAAVLALIIALT